MSVWLSTWIAISAATPAPPAGLVLWVEGSVDVSPGAVSAAVALGILDPLVPGEVVTLGPDSVLCAVLDEGGVDLVFGPGGVRVVGRGLSPDGARDRPAAEVRAFSVRDLAVSRPRSARGGRTGDTAVLAEILRAAIDLSRKSDEIWHVAEPGQDRCLPGDPPGFGSEVPIQAPRETLVLDRWPALEWAPDVAADRFSVRLSRLADDGTLEIVERWTNLQDPGLRPRRPLQEASFYLWEVEGVSGRSGDSMISEAAATWIGVPDSKHLEKAFRWLELLDSLEEASAAPTGSTVARHESAWRGAVQVLRALALEDLGLLSDAEDAWWTLAEDAFGTGPRILDRLRRLRGRRLTEPRTRSGPTAPVAPASGPE